MTGSLREWGHLVSFGVMILALFAFGLEVREIDDGFQLHIRWEEIPAILIVFVLAEVGVILVGTASDIRQQAEETRGKAEQTTARAERAAAAAVELINKTEEVATNQNLALGRTTDNLTRVLERTEAAQGALRTAADDLVASVHAGVWATAERFLVATKLEKALFWTALTDFIRSWTITEAHAGEHEQSLVGRLFRSFIGDDAGFPGSVRADSDSISCVTVDSVFTTVSTQWLKETIEAIRVTEGTERVVVWALTTLLPTEFAVPALLWRGADGETSRALRLAVLERFVEAVIDCCESEGLAEYRRVTIFKSPSLSDALPEAWCLIPNGGGGPSIPVRSVRATELSETLDLWFIWDPRTQQAEGRTAIAAGTELRQLLVEVIGRAAVAGMDRFARDVLVDAFGARGEKDATARIDGILQSHCLPIFTDTAVKRAHLFDFYGANEAGGEAYRYALVCAARVLLDEKIDVKPSSRSRLIGAGKARLGEHDGKTVRTVLRELGWMSLGEWYRSSLHYPRDSSAAEWIVLEDAKDVEVFSVEWDGYRWSTLDLLLIGTKSGQEETKWRGAAISNLQLDTPECVVRLVTRKEKLEDIGKIVVKLTERQGLRGGFWNEFPNPRSLPAESSSAEN